MTQRIHTQRIHLVIERADGSRSELNVIAQVTKDMSTAAEELLVTLTTGQRPLRGLYDLCAKAFGTTHDDARERLLAAMYGMDKSTFDKKLRLA